MAKSEQEKMSRKALLEIINRASRHAERVDRTQARSNAA